MQQLFSGKLQFKDANGNDYTDWEENKLGDVCEKIQDGNYGASYPKADEFIETGIPFLTSKALGNGGAIISSKIDYISLEKHKALKKAHLKLNDILFTNRGANVGAIGFVDESICHGNIGPQLTLLRTNQEIISSRFLFHSMNSFGVKKQVSSQDSGSAMNFFGIGVTSKFKIQVPSIPEQQKIADFLSSIDTKIESAHQEINQTQSFKKGLLQQMFV
jgi:type I restriction enzyme S subunit